MIKMRNLHQCTECRAEATRWAGRCSGCGAWNTLVEVAPPPAPGVLAEAVKAVALAEVAALGAPSRPTGLAELDRVLGGGLVRGSATLVGGEPGIGKSTLLLQALAAMARQGARCLLVSAEESVQQVRLRAERLAALPPGLWVLSSTDLPGITRAVDELGPDICVVDSIQAVHDPELGSGAGSVTQVRECANALVQLARRRQLSLLVVGHVTKDGALAGPRVLEHVVDTVLSFEGDRHSSLRLLRALKHRFGPTGELGLFEMGEAGLTGVADPSGLLLGDRRSGVPGSIVVPVLEGHRPLLVEVQALVSRVGPAPAPSRRSAQGLDGGRLALVLAVLEQRVGLSMSGADVYASAVGGVRVAEPAADLAVALALASASTGEVLPAHLVAAGEVGLAGELRSVSGLPRRLAEAARLGFRVAVVPESSPDGPPGLVLFRAATLLEALQGAGMSRRALAA